MLAIPVTPACVLQAAKKTDMPVGILRGIMATEGGWVGLKKRNSNGTYDYGPMQINSIWLPVLSRHGISGYMLRYNGCVNVYVGAWILADYVAEAGSMGVGIGYYHTHRPRAAYVYARQVLRARLTVSLDLLVRRANRNFGRSEK
jgi:hypothetical protein